jgi:hypothetical protein
MAAPQLCRNAAPKPCRSASPKPDCNTEQQPRRSAAAALHLSVAPQRRTHQTSDATANRQDHTQDNKPHHGVNPPRRKHHTGRATVSRHAPTTTYKTAKQGSPRSETKRQHAHNRRAQYFILLTMYYTLQGCSQVTTAAPHNANIFTPATHLLSSPDPHLSLHLFPPTLPSPPLQPCTKPHRRTPHPACPPSTPATSTQPRHVLNNQQQRQWCRHQHCPSSLPQDKPVCRARPPPTHTSNTVSGFVPTTQRYPRTLTPTLQSATCITSCSPSHSNPYNNTRTIPHNRPHKVPLLTQQPYKYNSHNSSHH